VKNKLKSKGVAQVIEHLPSKYKSLSSIPIFFQIRRRRGGGRRRRIRRLGDAEEKGVDVEDRKHLESSWSGR
jgi:hypothetical protein